MLVWLCVCACLFVGVFVVCVCLVVCCVCVGWGAGGASNADSLFALAGLSVLCVSSLVWLMCA